MDAALLHDWVLLRGLCSFVQIFDAGLIYHRPLTVPIAHLDGIAIMPFQNAFNMLAVFQYHHHPSLGLHLLLKVEGFGTGIFRVYGGLGVARRQHNAAVVGEVVPVLRQCPCG